MTPSASPAARGLRVAYAGTPGFAAQALQALLQRGYTVPLVLTQPDRPAGRGLHAQPGAVKQLALQQGLAVAQPRGLRLDGRFADEAAQARQALREAAPDVLVVAAYGLILPQWLLDLPPLGCLNIHASLLPRWRGAAPIQRAIEAGDAATGVSIIRMDAGLDTGPVYRMQETPILAEDNQASLEARLAHLGAELLLQVLQDLQCGMAEPVAQPIEGVAYAAKIDKAETWLDFRRPAAELERQVRALAPQPGARTLLDGAVLKIHRARVGRGAAAASPGCVLRADERGIEVACNPGSLLLERLQRAGGKPLDAAELLRGLPMRPGQVLERPEAARPA